MQASLRVRCRDVVNLADSSKKTQEQSGKSLESDGKSVFGVSPESEVIQEPLHRKSPSARPAIY